MDNGPLVILLTYRGLTETRYGYRFRYRGRLFKAMVGTTKALVVEAEKRERARLEREAFEGRWRALRPRLTPFPEAVHRYMAAKAQKWSLQHDGWHLEW